MKKNLIIYLNILLGAGLIFALIYFRFLRERPSGPLDSAYTSFKFWIIIISIFFFYFFTLVILLNPFLLTILSLENDQKTEKQRKQWRLLLFLQYSNHVISEAIKAFATPILSRIFNTFPEYTVSTVKKIRKIDKYYAYLATIFYFFPPALISLIFCIETIIYKEYTYFPFSIFLMIFPVGWRFFLYALRYFCESIEETYLLTIKIIHETEEGDTYYGWHEKAHEYIPLELQTNENLLQELGIRNINLETLALFNDWKLYLIISKNRYYIQIFTYTCLFITAFGKLILLH